MKIGTSVEMPTVEHPDAMTSEPEETAAVANVPAPVPLGSEPEGEPRHVPLAFDAAAIRTPTSGPDLPEPVSAPAITREVTGQPDPSSVTSDAANGSVSGVDLHGLARTFDHVRLDYRADGSLATRTLLDTEHPAAAIVIDYDAVGAELARHEIALPDRPYARVDIVYDAEGWAETRTRSGFVDGDLASVTVRLDASGTIARVEHLHVDGTRLIVGSIGADARAGEGDDRSTDTFVPIEAEPSALATADFIGAEGDRVDLSALLHGAASHVIGDHPYDGSADAVRFDRVDGESLVSSDVDGHKIADASMALHGVHAVQAADFGF